MNRYTILVRQEVIHRVVIETISAEEASKKAEEYIRCSWVKDLPEPVIKKTLKNPEVFSVVPDVK
jgi:hypothetical protein